MVDLRYLTDGLMVAESIATMRNSVFNGWPRKSAPKMMTGSMMARFAPRLIDCPDQRTLQAHKRCKDQERNSVRAQLSLRLNPLLGISSSGIAALSSSSAPRQPPGRPPRRTVLPTSRQNSDEMDSLILIGKGNAKADLRSLFQ